MGDPRMALPPELREALDREIDPGESLRWCGQPDPRRMWITYLPPCATGGVIGVVLGGALVFVAAMIWIEARDAGTPSGQEPVGTIGFTLAVAVLFFAASGWFWRQLWVHKITALSTVFALTNTRVLELVMLADGRAHLTAFEPSHPLAIRRLEHTDGTGTIVLNPGAQLPGGGPAPRASMILVGVREPRVVERLIRQTFDPPGVR
jgi:hypothetical protein